jgi:hypothetical protein
MPSPARRLTNDQKRRARMARLQQEFASLGRSAQAMKRAKTILLELLELEKVEARKRR